jgi:hypothetical protein
MMFFERAPPIKLIWTFAAWTNVPEIWKIQAEGLRLAKTRRQQRHLLSAGPPAIVISVEMDTPVVHLYNPGVRMEPPMRPGRRDIQDMTKAEHIISSYPLSIQRNSVLVCLIILSGHISDYNGKKTHSWHR